MAKPQQQISKTIKYLSAAQAALFILILIGFIFLNIRINKLDKKYDDRTHFNAVTTSSLEYCYEKHIKPCKPYQENVQILKSTDF